MPTLDGYRATQIIRTREPFKQAPFIPIVAMTASAIQGDKEKCQRAGMDDYLAKPVQGRVLENMLVKWALEAKRKRERAGDAPSPLPWQHKAPGIDGEHFANEPTLRPSISHPTSNDDLSTVPGAMTSPTMQATTSPGSNPREFAATSAWTKSAETEDQTQARRAEADERAIFLRDDKLLAAADNPRLQHQTSEDSERKLDAPTLALTEENVDRLADKQHSNGSMDRIAGMLGVNAEAGRSNTSLLVNAEGAHSRGPSGDLKSGEPRKSSRPRLGPTRRDSERTIQGLRSGRQS